MTKRIGKGFRKGFRSEYVDIICLVILFLVFFMALFMTNGVWFIVDLIMLGMTGAAFGKIIGNMVTV